MMRTWRRLTYTCDGDAKVVVNLHAKLARVVFKGHTYNMKQVDEFDGQKYTDGSLVWRNKDEVGSLERASKSGNSQIAGLRLPSSKCRHQSARCHACTKTAKPAVVPRSRSANRRTKQPIPPLYWPIRRTCPSAKLLNLSPAILESMESAPNKPPEQTRQVGILVLEENPQNAAAVKPAPRFRRLARKHRRRCQSPSFRAAQRRMGLGRRQRSGNWHRQPGFPDFARARRRPAPKKAAASASSISFRK